MSALLGLLEVFLSLAGSGSVILDADKTFSRSEVVRSRHSMSPPSTSRIPECLLLSSDPSANRHDPRSLRLIAFLALRGSIQSRFDGYAEVVNSSVETEGC